MKPRLPKRKSAPVAGAVDAKAPVLEVRDLHVHFKLSNGRRIQAVDGLNFRLHAGKTLGIVGESGSGKTTVVRAILRIVDAPGKIDSGQILFRNTNLLRLSESQMRDLRGKKISMIFQDPSSSLDPLFTIGSQFIETMRGFCRRERRLMGRQVDAIARTHMADAHRFPKHVELGHGRLALRRSTCRR